MFGSNFLVKIVSLVTDIIVSLLSLQIILKLFGASTAAPFVVWVYNTTRPILSPFQGMFPTPDIAPSLTIDFSAIFALIAYSFIGNTLVNILRQSLQKNNS